MPAHRISAVGYGDRRPLQPNETAEGLTANRRVDLVVLSDQPERIHALLPIVPTLPEGERRHAHRQRAMNAPSAQAPPRPAADQAEGRGRDPRGGPEEGKKKLFVIVGSPSWPSRGAAYFFVCRTAARPRARPRARRVSTVEAMRINLAGGHYLQARLRCLHADAAGGPRASVRRREG